MPWYLNTSYAKGAFPLMSVIPLRNQTPVGRARMTQPRGGMFFCLLARAIEAQTENCSRRIYLYYAAARQGKATALRR